MSKIGLPKMIQWLFENIKNQYYHVCPENSLRHKSLLDSWVIPILA